ncbi:acyclic terpene utilization AtuA family protein [Sporichthya sp.]|uniref:acyclic terpene utilization AtuA family protein n=1 Tax=Sporichthya sp. TaxID=65475 RepID=UPI0017BA17C9|nr:acyclic terpene utilization AtuA family protein [Sporichthya sp.]MBA3741518.1 DUF1446 domain-containing protein [Sporichthya sp.]
MTDAPCRIGAGSGFWGDMIDPAVELANEGRIDYLCFDLLAELTMSILQRRKIRNPGAGYITDLAPMIRQVLPAATRNGVKIITNGGGANPPAGAHAIAEVALELGHPELRIGVIEGDDLTDRIQGIRRDGWRFANLETGEQDIDRIADRVVAAHAYTGSDGIIAALGDAADVVLGGRLADSALYCGPLMHHFGWTFTAHDWERIGAALTIGHVLECAGLCSGGMSSQWRHAKDVWRLGFPLAEVAADGTATIEKVKGSGGLINRWTVKEHLLYEVHDPHSYLLPDAIVDLGGVRVTEVGPDQVRLIGMTGRERPDTLKVQIGYQDGFIAESRALISWPDALEKADWCEELVRRRLEYIGVTPLEQRYDRVGVNALAGSAAPDPGYEPNEVDFRMVVKTRTKAEAEVARRALLLPATAGPVGTAFGAPSPVREVIALWPTLVPRSLIDEAVTVSSARELQHART